MKKKLLLLTMAVFALCFQVAAQYAKGNITVNAGISFGLIGYGYGYYGSASGFLPVSANVEYSVNERFAVGPYVGYLSRSYDEGDFKFSALSLGGRGTFHASAWLNDKLDMNISEKLDVYASLIMGVESLKWKYADESYDGYYANRTRFILGPSVGARYFFSPKFAGFLEFGRGAFGLGTLGISAKL